ncbi:MAG: hypothetical protein V5789_06205 [Colwellia sp.]
MFFAHGDWKIIVKNNCVLQWFSGYWNEEAAIQYSQEFSEQTQHLKGEPWAIISFLDDWILAVPEVELHGIDHSRQLKDDGCIKHCHVYAPSALKGIQLERMVLPTEGDYERRVFDEISSAISWLESCGFLIDVDAINTGALEIERAI